MAEVTIDVLKNDPYQAAGGAKLFDHQGIDKEPRLNDVRWSLNTLNGR